MLICGCDDSSSTMSSIAFPFLRRTTLTGSLQRATVWHCKRYASSLEEKRNAAFLGGGTKRLEKQHQTVS